jgi:quaternary ammonium compound-resistance protein SugE
MPDCREMNDFLLAADHRAQRQRLSLALNRHPKSTTHSKPRGVTYEWRFLRSKQTCAPSHDRVVTSRAREEETPQSKSYGKWVGGENSWLTVGNVEVRARAPDGGEMPWIYLLIAGLLEIAWAAGLKYSNGFSRLWPSVATIALMVASFVLLGRAVRSIPVGTAYAAWTGIGAVGTAIVGIVFFEESREVGRLFCILLIVFGVVGLKFLGD